MSELKVGSRVWNARLNVFGTVSVLERDGNGVVTGVKVVWDGGGTPSWEDPTCLGQPSEPLTPPIAPAPLFKKGDKVVHLEEDYGVGEVMYPYEKDKTAVRFKGREYNKWYPTSLLQLADLTPEKETEFLDPWDAYRCLLLDEPIEVRMGRDSITGCDSWQLLDKDCVDNGTLEDFSHGTYRRKQEQPEEAPQDGWYWADIGEQLPSMIYVGEGVAQIPFKEGEDAVLSSDDYMILGKVESPVEEEK